MVAGGAEGPVAWPDPDLASPLRQAIVAVTLRADTLIAATAERLLWRAPGAAWVAERVVVGELGALRAIVADAGGVWLGGEGGLGFFRFRGRDLTVYRVPHDVPGPVQDIALTAGHVWVATPLGLVRFSRASLVP
jgi:hypothetical protein